MRINLFEDENIFKRGRAFTVRQFIKKTGIDKINKSADIHSNSRMAIEILHIYESAKVIKRIGCKRNRKRGRPTIAYLCLKNIKGWNLISWR